MITTQMLNPTQFLVDDNGQQTAVLLDIKTWELLVAWIEQVKDTQLAIQILKDLAGIRPQQANWLAWDEVREGWDE